jgi:hypothetical protein
VGRNGPLFLCAEEVGFATFDITLSPHGRINAPSLLLAFAHIHGEAGRPTLQFVYFVHFVLQQLLISSDLEVFAPPHADKRTNHSGFTSTI